MAIAGLPLRQNKILHLKSKNVGDVKTKTSHALAFTVWFGQSCPADPERATWEERRSSLSPSCHQTSYSSAVGFHGGLITKSFRGSQLPKAVDSLSANHHARFSKEPHGAEAGASLAAKETVALALV